MPRHERRPPPKPKRKRLLDRALGVSRRRRQVAYLSIAAGIRLLRPAMQRVGLAAAFAAFSLAVLAVT